MLGGLAIYLWGKSKQWKAELVAIRREREEAEKVLEPLRRNLEIAEQLAREKREMILKYRREHDVNSSAQEP